MERETERERERKREKESIGIIEVNEGRREIDS